MFTGLGQSTQERRLAGLIVIRGKSRRESENRWDLHAGMPDTHATGSQHRWLWRRHPETRTNRGAAHPESKPGQALPERVDLRSMRRHSCIDSSDLDLSEWNRPDPAQSEWSIQQASVIVLSQERRSRLVDRERTHRTFRSRQSTCSACWRRSVRSHRQSHNWGR